MAKSAQPTNSPQQTNKSRTAGTVPSGGRPETKGATKKASKAPPRRNSPLLLLGIIAAVILVAVVIIIFATRNAQAPIVATERVGEGTAWGAENAPVVIEEYSDYGCHYCAQFSETTGKQLRETYEATGQVRFEFNHFIIGGPTTANAANAAECAADQGRFWDYNDALFARQGTSADPFNKTALKEYAAALGLDMAQFNQCVDADQHIEKVYQASNLGRGRGVQATPTFFIGGQKIEGAEAFQTFQAVIDAALASANQ